MSFSKGNCPTISSSCVSMFVVQAICGPPAPTPPTQDNFRLQILSNFLESWILILEISILLLHLITALLQLFVDAFCNL